MDLKEYDAAGIVRLIEKYLRDNGVRGFSARTQAYSWNNGAEDVVIYKGIMRINQEHLKKYLTNCYLEIHGHRKTHTVNPNGTHSYDDMSPTLEISLVHVNDHSETSETHVIENKDQLENLLDNIIVATPDITKMLKKVLKLLEVIESNTNTHKQ